jgi:hypothetical protein
MDRPSRGPEPTPPLHRDPWLWGILALALLLRLPGLGHDLPQVYNPDEVNIMARTLSLASDPNPHYFLYPSFLFYLLFASLGGLFVFGYLLGRYPGLAAFEREFFTDPTAFYLVGRGLVVAAALATIALTYHLAARRFGRTTARAAAFFLAVSYVHVRDSHYLKHDVVAGFLVILALLAFARTLSQGERRDYLGAGAAMGVAFATHYYTIFLAPAFALCHLVSAARPTRRLLAAGLVAALVFFLLSPFVLLDLSEALGHMQANRELVIDRAAASGSAFMPSLKTYLDLLVDQALGWPLALLAVAGAFLIARAGAREAALWGGFPLPFFIFITFTFGPGRYLNPILPVLAVASGVAVAAIARRGPFLAGAVALLTGAWPLYYSIQVDRLFLTTDTRTLAREWILEHLPDGEAVALQSFSVPIPQSLESLKEGLRAHGAEAELTRARKGKYAHLAAIAAEGGAGYNLYFIGKGDEKERIYFDYPELVASSLEPLRSRRVRYLVLRHAPAEPPPRIAALFEEVARQGKLAARFSPFPPGANLAPYLDNEDWPARRKLLRKGPLTEIWSLDDR